LFENALIYANLALYLDPKHEKTLFRKALALAFLYKFQQSIEILDLLKMPEVIKQVESLAAQTKGDYSSYFENHSESNFFTNYIDGVDIQLTKSMGRGVFATRDLKKGTTIVIEKPLAVGPENPNLGPVQSLVKIRFFDSCH
jgi:hypothetical protein